MNNELMARIDERLDIISLRGDGLLLNLLRDCKAALSPSPDLQGLREKLFAGWTGCSNHGCIVTGPKSGMGTNSVCQCVVNASRGQLHILQGRLVAILSASPPAQQPAPDSVPLEAEAEDVTLDMVLLWADGVLSALGTEHAGKVTEREAEIASRILSHPPKPSPEQVSENLTAPLVRVCRSFLQGDATANKATVPFTLLSDVKVLLEVMDQGSHPVDTWDLIKRVRDQVLPLLPEQEG